ncbi:MAG: hypothetical protein E6H65_05385 [Betaproteobacteria bacterium]|nr:MAG: hypothetical protein E6H65_05385 [Betaproteobacteria bacterium]
MKARFDELLPFYVNGSLSDDDRAWVDGYLREHPAAAAELNWYQSLQTQLREDVPAVSSEVGLERALKRIRTEGPAPQRSRRAAGPSLVDRISDWLAAVLPQPVLRPAFAGAVAVVALQAVVIVHLMGQRDDDVSEIRARSTRARTSRSTSRPTPAKPTSACCWSRATAVSPPARASSAITTFAFRPARSWRLPTS